jgi:hypothetical protein
MPELMRNLKFAFRLLRKSPGFALVAILIMALGIGANTATSASCMLFCWNHCRSVTLIGWCRFGTFLLRRASRE